jgi:hypothetical protein
MPSIEVGGRRVTAAPLAVDMPGRDRQSIGTCPDGELLASYIDGCVTRREKVAIVAHLLRCTRCFIVCSDTFCFQESEGSPTSPVSRMAREIRYIDRQRSMHQLLS